MRTPFVGPMLVAMSLAGPPVGAEVSHLFATSGCVIQMKVEFPEPYLGTRLSLHDTRSGREICVAADGSFGGCIERFVGAMAAVTYIVRQRKSGAPAKGAIRERVTLTAQSEGLPERPPFEKTQRLIDGTVSDIQVFGYAGEPLENNEKMFRSYRQYLYLNQDAKPFAVIAWKHTLERITIVRVEVP